MSPRDRNAKIASRTVPDDYEEDETLPVESAEQVADDAVDHSTEAPRARSRRTGTEETIELDEDEDDGLSDTEREEVRQEALRAKKTTGRGGATAVTKKGTASTSKVPGLKRARATLEDEIETRSGPEPAPKRRALTGAPAKGKGPAAEDEVEEGKDQMVSAGKGEVKVVKLPDNKKEPWCMFKCKKCAKLHVTTVDLEIYCDTCVTEDLEEWHKDMPEGACDE